MTERSCVFCGEHLGPEPENIGFFDHLGQAPMCRAEFDTFLARAEETWLSRMSGAA